MGVWLFVLIFVVMSVFGGSFIGFFVLVYMYGWIVVLWIGSYMIVFLVLMGLFVK